MIKSFKYLYDLINLEDMSVNDIGQSDLNKDGVLGKDDNKIPKKIFKKIDKRDM